MTYEDLIKTISEIAENEKIIKNGLTLVYTLSDKAHRNMNEVVFRKSNPNPMVPIEYNNELEINVENEAKTVVITVKIIKETTNTVE